MVINRVSRLVLGGLAQNSTKEGAIVQKHFNTWEECSDYVINKMSNYSVIAFTSPFRAFCYSIHFTIQSFRRSRILW